MAQESITSLSAPQVERLVLSLGEPAFRSRQLLNWVYKRLAISYHEMTDLPVGLRQKLEQHVALGTLTVAREQESADGTVKALFRLRDGATIEAGLMLYAAGAGRPRTTVCLSTQVGCPIGCCFCTTGQQGFERNLTPGEMLDQVLYFARRLRREGGRGRLEHITNVVFMGMGEPLANYDAVMGAIDTLTSPEAFELSARSITISTAGLVPQIRRLSQDRPRIGLAISLHAPDNSLRDSLVPLNTRYPIEEILAAGREYTAKTGRRVSFEYVLLAGVNDSIAHAQALARLLKGMNCHVNLIPANPARDSQYRASSRRVTLEFERVVRAGGISCTIRQSRGQDIDAGCGQLRSRPGD